MCDKIINSFIDYLSNVIEDVLKKLLSKRY